MFLDFDLTCPATYQAATAFLSVITAGQYFSYEFSTSTCERKCITPFLWVETERSEPTYLKELEKEGATAILEPRFFDSSIQDGPRLCPGLLPCLDR